MLLSSALPPPLCDPPSQTRRPTRFFASPPTSPLSPQSQGAFSGNLLNTCYTLQSMMAPSQPHATALPLFPSNELPPPAELSELPTPPMTYATPPPSAHKRLGVRAAPSHSHGSIPESRHLPKKKIVKRTNAPASCFFSDHSHTYSNKRRRAAAARESSPDAKPEPEPEPSLGSDISFSEDAALPSQENATSEPEQPQPLTPKRSRIAPEQLPLGLDASDFHTVHQGDPELQQQLEQQKGTGTGVERNKDGELWSVEDDKILLELVLAKIKLNPSEWDECASVMGRDGRSLDRRWKTLIEHRQVRVSSHRAKLHSTWR